MARKKSNRSKQWLIVAAVIVLAAVIVAGLELTDTTHFFHKSTPATQVIVSAGKRPSNQNTVTKSGGQSDKATSTSNGVNKGTATDTNGQATSTDPSKWVVSASGNITVKQPVANDSIKDGSVLSGSAKVGQVQYRLIDDKLGVISQGQLSVKNGNFSGQMHFQPAASTGRLDVFSYDSNGTEINEVQIAVRFGS